MNRNRAFVYRGQKVAGVYQRCNRDCPASRCTEHRWAFHIELPAGPDGRRRQVTKGAFPTGRDAMKAREDVGTADRDGKISTGPRTTFAGWSAEWLATKVEMGKLRPSTKRAHEDALELHLVPRLGKHKLKDLTVGHLERAYGAIMRDRQKLIEEAARTGRKAVGAKGQILRPISPSSIRRMHSIVSNCLASAEKNNLVPRNVARLVDLPDTDEQKPNYWTPQQGQQFLSWLHEHGDRLYPLIHLAMYNGLRRGELLALGWADVDLDDGTFKVWRQRVTVAGEVSVVEKPKTKAGDRRMPLFADTVAALRQWRAQQNRERLQWGPAWNDGGWVFTHEDGKPLYPDSVGRTFRKLTDQAGLPRLRFHDLRHTFATTGRTGGVDMATLSKVMGHSSQKITNDRYAHVSLEAHLQVINRIGETFRDATG
ncbi:tyrosine-type recombinase/integrase [Micromonospora arida]|uniref:tyrosine-type recombinase/integrase n=1 Tax=Micromonospora arida TaxID=2203715 RepID=UPI003689F523